MDTVDLTGHKGGVVGIVNEHSVAWPAAQRFRGAGAELAIPTSMRKPNAVWNPWRAIPDATSS